MSLGTAIGIGTAAFCFVILALYTIQRTLRNYGIRVNFYYRFTLPSIFLILCILPFVSEKTVQIIATIACILFVLGGIFLLFSMIGRKERIANVCQNTQEGTPDDAYLNLQEEKPETAQQLIGKKTLYISIIVYSLSLLIYVLLMIPRPENILHQKQFYDNLSYEAGLIIEKDMFDKLAYGEATIEVEMPNKHFIRFYDGFNEKIMLDACKEYWSIVEKYSAKQRRDFLLKVGLIWVFIPFVIFAIRWSLLKIYRTCPKFVGCSRERIVNYRKITIFCAIAIGAIMAIFPPWISKINGIIRDRGYAFLFTLRGYREIDFLTLLIQWCALALVTVLILYIAKDSAPSFTVLFNWKYKRSIVGSIWMGFFIFLICLVFGTGYLPIPTTRQFKSGLIDSLGIWSHWSSSDPDKITGKKPAADLPLQSSAKPAPGNYDPTTGLYRSNNWGFSIQFETGWQLEERQIDNYLIVSTRNNSGESMHVVVKNNSPESQDTNIGSFSKRGLHNFIQKLFEEQRKIDPDKVLVDFGRGQLAKKKAAYLITQFLLMGNLKRQYTIITFHKGKSYTVGGMAPPEIYGPFEKKLKKVAETLSLQ